MPIPTNHTKEIERRLNKLGKQFNISWYHDCGEDGKFHEDVGVISFMYYVLHSEIKIDDYELLSSITSAKDGIEFHKLWSDRNWVKFQKFDNRNLCFKDCYRLNIQCIVSRPLFDSSYRLQLARERFITKLVMNFVPDKKSHFEAMKENIYNPYDLSGGDWYL